MCTRLDEVGSAGPSGETANAWGEQALRAGALKNSKGLTAFVWNTSKALAFVGMPRPKDKIRAAALKKVWVRLRAFLAAELARLPSPNELWKKVEGKAEEPPKKSDNPPTAP